VGGGGEDDEGFFLFFFSDYPPRAGGFGRWGGGASRRWRIWPRSSASSARTAATSAFATSRTASRVIIHTVWGRRKASLILPNSSFVVSAFCFFPPVFQPYLAAI
jgi:hypothetical protein